MKRTFVIGRRTRRSTMLWVVRGLQSLHRPATLTGPWQIRAVISSN